MLQNPFAFFLFITVTFEFINIFAYDLDLADFVPSLALDKHTGSLPLCSVSLRWGDMDVLDSDQRHIVVNLVNHTVNATAVIQLVYLCYYCNTDLCFYFYTTICFGRWGLFLD